MATRLPPADPLGSALDRGAFGLSGLCLAHCLALPLLAALVPALSTALPPDEWVHPLIFALALPSTGWAMWRGVRRHGRVAPALLGAVGLALLGIGLSGVGLLAATLPTVAGGIAIAAAHLVNRRLDALSRRRASLPG